MVKRHLKRHASPRTWKLERKDAKFVVRPRPGAHSLSMGVSIASILKGQGFCETTKEVKRALSRSLVLVNNRRVVDFKHIVGFMDVLSLPEKGLHYRVSLDEKGKLATVETIKEEALLLPCRVNSLRKIKGGFLQLNCHNGYNINTQAGLAKIGDTLVLNLETREINQHIPLKPGVLVVLTGGSFSGKLATLEKVGGTACEIKVDNKKHSTPTRFVFAIGDKAPVVNVR